MLIARDFAKICQRASSRSQLYIPLEQAPMTANYWKFSNKSLSQLNSSSMHLSSWKQQIRSTTPSSIFATYLSISKKKSVNSETTLCSIKFWFNWTFRIDDQSRYLYFISDLWKGARGIQVSFSLLNLGQGMLAFQYRITHLFLEVK